MIEEILQAREDQEDRYERYEYEDNTCDDEFEMLRDDDLTEVLA